METITILKSKMNAILVFAFIMFTSVAAFAQENTGEVVEKVNSTKTTTTTEWYADPMYIIGGAVILIIIIALIARGGKRND
ncbi:hypothetical protein ATE47_17685 [Chryseobacterium sp. IHB B 17019]|jgi:hypothetical protein|uniref:hypothetical protein n=1 Tax=Chryseobacterium sp. IHB B 17019 TaxID=1721091 RepID=UPI00071EE9E1|nr:hypothetical protein [Chryseobacterium sp. IHB B 17019]ALR32236.1 hypothetical protein ATE47_17685 [Chryseobacterium sp. IHB B 17019]